MFTPAMLAIIAVVLSPLACPPQKSFPSISISNEEPAVKSQLGLTSKVSLKVFCASVVVDSSPPNSTPLGSISDSS